MRRRLAPELSFAIPGDIAARTGGYAYDRRLIAELRCAGWSVEHLAWGPSFPFPTPADLAAAGRSLAALADGSLVLIDGLAFGALPELAAREGTRLRLAALVHHPLAEESGLDDALRERLRSSERRALAMARAVIATSRTTAHRLGERYGVAPARLAVACPGSDPAGPPPPRPAAGAVELLSVGTLTHRKGHDILIEALARLAGLPWRCRIIGSEARAPLVAAALRAQIGSLGLGERIALGGEVDEISPCYHCADIFVLASRHEGYGMVFNEALRHGLPIIATTAGAVPEAVPATAGLLVPPEDPTALAAALRRLILDPLERKRLATGARAAAGGLPGWRDTARTVSSALTNLASSA